MLTNVVLVMVLAGVDVTIITGGPVGGVIVVVPAVGPVVKLVTGTSVTITVLPFVPIPVTVVIPGIEPVVVCVMGCPGTSVIMIVPVNVPLAGIVEVPGTGPKWLLANYNSGR
jgi:hypothetical protein